VTGRRDGPCEAGRHEGSCVAGFIRSFTVFHDDVTRTSTADDYTQDDYYPAFAKTVTIYTALLRRNFVVGVRSSCPLIESDPSHHVFGSYTDVVLLVPVSNKNKHDG